MNAFIDCSVHVREGGEGGREGWLIRANDTCRSCRHNLVLANWWFKPSVSEGGSNESVDFHGKNEPFSDVVY